MTTECDVKQVSWQSHSSEIRAIRDRVFIEEQGVPKSEEWDGLDELASTRHFLAFAENGTAGGTLRLVATSDGHDKITRLAVKTEYRNQGMASALLRKSCESVLSGQHQRLYMHAQTSAAKLYEKFGFIASGATFFEAGIEHVEMNFNHKNSVAFEQIFGAQVLRLSYPEQFISHAINIAMCGTRRLDICSINLRDDIFSAGALVDALSTFARSDRRALLRILVHSTNGLGRRSLPLIELARRLPSKIQIKTLTPGCEEKPESFICGDARQLIYFNDENKLNGFCCYLAGPESEKRLDAFEHAWAHMAQSDPNLDALHI